MIPPTPSDFRPSERKLVASFPAHLATHLRTDRLGNERRARELCSDLRAMTERPEPLRASGGMGAGGFTARRRHAAARFDPLKLSSCVLDFDISDPGSFSLAPLTVPASSDFASASWSKLNVSVTSDNVIAPDGNLTADTLTAVPGTTNAIYQLLVYVSKITFYAKAVSGVQWLILLMGTTGAINTRSVSFDIQNGVLGTVGNQLAGAKMIAVGNGWYRCEATKLSAIGSNFFDLYFSTTDGVIVDPADGSSVALWNVTADQFQVASLINRATRAAYTNATSAQCPGYYPAGMNGRAMFYFGGAHCLTTTADTTFMTAVSGTNPDLSFTCAMQITASLDAENRLLVALDPTLNTGFKSAGWGTTASSTGRYCYARADATISALYDATAQTFAGANVVQTRGTAANVALCRNGGAEVSEGNATVGNVTGLTSVALGGLIDVSPGNFFTGNLGGIAVHSRYLSSAEHSWMRVGFGYRHAITVTP